ncbi:glycosyltransferase [uncultured Methylibium sp.]|uniref:glycosyltransferase n=1 Tax=uncultured Methylibium sp. TaxID=381093 RepID=UPI0025CD2050|nr:glycosyltransferase [uncultured Methylibium sp.]
MNDRLELPTHASTAAPIDGPVVHLAWRLSDSIFGFIGPATEALARAGLAQCIVLVDDAEASRLMPRLPRDVELVTVPDARDPLRLHKDLGDALRTVLQRTPPRAVHLHGFTALTIGSAIARREAGDARLYFSPHLLRALGATAPLLRALPGGWLRHSGLLDGQRMIVNRLEEAYTLHQLTRQPMQVVESAVAPAYFDAATSESRHPLIVTGSQRDDRRGVELFAQLAVLLSGSDLRLSFNWIGRLGAASVARLKAANVGYFEIDDDAAIAARLAAGWVFLAPGDSPGFPAFLAQAMAMGLPCVAMESPEHTDLLRDRETGFLCRSDVEAMERIARLIDEPLLRRQIGQAARREAQSRFSPESFRGSLYAAYELEAEPAPAPLHRLQRPGFAPGAAPAFTTA